MEKEEKKESSEKTKGNSVKYSVLLVLAVLIGILVGYGLSNINRSITKEDDVVVKEENGLEEEKNEQETKSRELTQNEKAVLLSQIKEYNTRIPDLYGAEIKLDNQRLLQFASIYARPKTISAEEYKEITFSAESVRSIIKKYFYIENEIQHTNIKCDVCGDDRYIYNEDTKVYSYNKEQNGHGGAGMIPDSYVSYLSGTIENEKAVVVKTKILYAGWCSDICLNFCSAYYGTYDDARNSKNSLLGNSSSEEKVVVTDDMYASVADKLKTTVFTFIKDNEGNFGLKSVTFE